MIPRQIHAVWVGPAMPEHLSANLTRWAELHPDWRLRLWRDDDLDWLEHRDLLDRAYELVPVDAVGQLRSDIARYEILRKHGGLYVDCDTYPLRPVDEALEGLETIAAREDRNWIGNTYVGAVAGHPALEELVSGLRRSVRDNRGKRPNWICGPRYLTPIWRKHGCYVAPQWQWYPYSYRDVIAGTVPTEFHPGVVAVHGWQHHRDQIARRGRR